MKVSKVINLLEQARSWIGEDVNVLVDEKDALFYRNIKNIVWGTYPNKNVYILLSETEDKIDEA